MAGAMTDSANGLKKVQIASPTGSTAEVYLHGAHLTSWKNNNGEEQIFVSKQAVFKPPKAIRGGIPVCFPQFGDMGPIKAQHGFARNTEFTVVTLTAASVTLSLTPNQEQRQGDFPEHTLFIKVTVGNDTLTQVVQVANSKASDKPLKFTTALHTYFRVSDISQVHVEGLSGLKYLDNMQNRQQGTDEQDVISVKGEIDRIYVEAPDQLKIVNKQSGKAVSIHKTNFPDAVVWNPWIAKAKGMADFEDEEYKEMICVEVALATTGPIELPPGDNWVGTQVLTTSSL
ncbi:hypothetical protein ABBQ38_014117 [Trebouxia sp. C0009 RCD-2024]